MSTIYRFEIKSRNPKHSHGSVTTIQASTISEAKNKFKSLHPEDKIISCVKLGEVFDPRKPSQSAKKSNSEDSPSLLGSLISLLFK